MGHILSALSGLSPHDFAPLRVGVASFGVSRGKVVVCSAQMDETNKVYFANNLNILREHVTDASVDLIYLDPPFKSNANYNVLFKEKSGEESAAQITAFEDTWQWSIEAEAVYKEIVTSGPPKLADLVQALLAFLGRNDTMAYLVMMAIRLVELHRVLRPTGSIYLYCDPTAKSPPPTQELTTWFATSTTSRMKRERPSKENSDAQDAPTRGGIHASAIVEIIDRDGDSSMESSQRGGAAYRQTICGIMGEDRSRQGLDRTRLP
jgi:hypothetical protein